MIYTKGAIESYRSDSLAEIILAANNLTPLSKLKVDFDSVCFVCGEKMVDTKMDHKKKKTDEHLIPKWLLKELKIRERKAKITLPNSTTSFLDRSIIPCCHDCNTGYMSRLENREVKRVLKKEISSLNDEDEFVLFCWFSKIVSGQILRMTTFPNDRSKPDSEMIIPPDKMNLKSEIFTLPKLIRYPNVAFYKFKPFSFYAFELLEESSKNPIPHIIGLRFPVILFVYKKKAYLMALGEGGAIKEYFPKMTVSSNTPGDILMNFSRVCTQYELLIPNYYYEAERDNETGLLYIRRVPKLVGIAPFKPMNRAVLEKNINEHFAQWEIDIEYEWVDGNLRYWSPKVMTPEKLQKKRKKTTKRKEKKR